MKVLWAVGALLLAGALAGCGDDSSNGESGESPAEEPDAAPDEPSDLGVLRVAISAPESMDYLAATVGMELGVWEDRGLTVENIDSSGGQVPQILAAGEADIGLTGGPGSLGAVVKGLPAQMVAAITPSVGGTAMAVAADSDTQELADLEGGTLGYTGPGSTTDLVTRIIAEDQGWVMGEDIQQAPLGGINEMVAALQSGAIDAFVWSPEPVFALEEEGEAKALGTLESLGVDSGGVLSGAAFAMDDLISSRPEAVQAYLDGYFEVVEYLKENRDFTIDYVTENFGLSQFVAERTFEEYVATDSLSDTGEYPPGMAEAMADAIVLVDEEIEEAPDVSGAINEEFVPAGSS